MHNVDILPSSPISVFCHLDADSRILYSASRRLDASVIYVSFFAPGFICRPSPSKMKSTAYPHHMV